MTTTNDEDRHPKARKPLGHTATIPLKMHPDLYAFIVSRAAVNYCSTQEYLRRLIVNDMRSQGVEQ
jgi:hypothetical protein